MGQPTHIRDIIPEVMHDVWLRSLGNTRYLPNNLRPTGPCKVPQRAIGRIGFIGLHDCLSRNSRIDERRDKMLGYIKVLALGNVTRDPDLRYTSGGKAVANFGLAANNRKTDDERGDDVCFIDVIAWERNAENAAQYLAKGCRVFVEGRLKMERWEQDDGQKRSKLKLVLGIIRFLDYASDHESGQGEGGDEPPF